MRALVTGGAGAFGSAVAAALRDRGWTVVTSDVVGAVDVPADIASDSSVAPLRAAAGDALELLVHCAGVGLPSDVGAPPDDAARHTLEVNLLGAWRAVGACMPALLAARGRIVLVASGLAYVPVPFAGAYAVSKRALSGYADQVRAEYGTQVSVTTLYPGYVPTPIHDAGAAIGLSFAGQVPTETVAGVVRKILDVSQARRPPRDAATTWRTGLAVAAGRRAPRALDAVISLAVRRLVRRGAFDGSDATAGFRGRHDRA
ncbi:MAG: short-chain dehydrogenase/reductase [Frankiales bacterium]|nr:short-chain dehydrogenase/reductase [Frankiales bacterium]